MTRGPNRTLLVACLVILAMVGVLGQSAAIGGDALRQTRTRPPAAILRSVTEGDFSTVVHDILSAAGQPDTVIRIRPADDAKTARASLEGGRKTIEYNPRFLSQLEQLAQTEWAIVLVLSHEVAHLLGGHVTRKMLSHDDLRRMELEADHATGFLLARLGASLGESSRSLNAGCQLDGTSGVDCAAFEDAVKVGWRAGTKPAGRTGMVGPA